MDASTTNGASSFGSGATPHGKAPGQAALLLVECLMHTLVDKGVLSREEFIECVEGAAEVEHELLTTNATIPPDGGGSFLYPLANAFRQELGR